MTEANKSKPELPLIPEKRYFSIGEAAALCAVKPHVLRYWEQEFSQLKPDKRRGNRRYYQRADVIMIRKIRELLYSEGYTIEGARQTLTGKKTKVLHAETRKTNLREAILDLEQLLESLRSHEIQIL
jgi:DNA-binding transcriptional MerR regulator